MISIQQNISLKKFNTFGINAIASKYCEIEEHNDILELIQSGLISSMPYFVVGGGSNLLFTSDFDGLIIKSNLKTIEVIEDSNDDIIISAGSGLNWHQFLKYCIANNYYGLENLSKIPGTVGAAPVQNIGAYGAEQKDCFHSLTAVNFTSGERIELTNADCKFDYRFSIFKTEEFRNKYFVESVRYRLSHKPIINANYKDIQVKMNNDNIANPDAEYLFKAIEEIRDAKLPDPDKLGNAGSFFKNPIVSLDKFAELQLQDETISSYPDIAGKKIPAAWLIENCGLKGYRIGDAGISDKHSLILINYGNANGSEIYDLSEYIISKVLEKFGITLEREVIIVSSN